MNLDLVPSSFTCYTCRKCRQELDITDAVIPLDECCHEGTSCHSCIYLDIEHCPRWIKDAVEQSFWTKGKLTCSKCKGRLGSFDFCTVTMFPCRQHIIPPIHVLENRVDKLQKRLRKRSGNGQPTHIASTSANPIGYVEQNQPNDIDTESHCDTGRGTVVGNSHGGSRSGSHCEDAASNFGSPHKARSPSSTVKKQGLRSRGKHQVKRGAAVEEEVMEVPEEFTCAVCYELYVYPTLCQPCEHMFCEPCLRRLCKTFPVNTRCPMCRGVIRKCVPNKELEQTIQATLPRQYKGRCHQHTKINETFCHLPSSVGHQHRPPAPVNHGRNFYHHLKIMFIVLCLGVVFVALVAALTGADNPDDITEALYTTLSSALEE